MFYLAFAVIMYVCGLVFLYGVIRLAVRHGVEDVETRRERLAAASDRRAPREPALLRENVYLANN